MKKVNTVGSLLNTEKAYIAGFLDGDGSIMLQLKRRSDTSRGYRFMATVCFYQDTRHDETLYWMRDVLNLGYLSKRNDNITELRINGFTEVRTVLTMFQPFIRFKLLQTDAMIKACRILEIGIKRLSKSQLFEVVNCMMIIQNENYKSHKKKSREEILKVLNMTP
jgi:hypothetical protein